jgi:hypothetical protein
MVVALAARVTVVRTIVIEARLMSPTIVLLAREV